MFGKGQNSARLQAQRDRRLVRGMLAGNQKAFKTFVDEYFPKLYRYAYQRLRDHQKVEEIIQEGVGKSGAPN